MKITLVSETFPPEINGVALTVSSMAGGLRDLGHEVTVIRPRQAADPGEHIQGITDLQVPGARLPRYRDLRFGLPVIWRLLRRWKRERPDAIYIATEGPLGWAAAHAARRLGIPASSGFHTRFDEFVKHYGLGLAVRLAEGYMRHFHNLNSATLVPTRQLQDWLSKQGYRRVELLQRSVDTRRFNGEFRSQRLRQSWGAAPDTPVVIFVGRIAPEKNLGLTVRAFERFRQHRPTARMVWVGDGPALAELKASQPDHVFTGPLSGEALSEAWASADAFFFASSTETFGNVTLEALASGLAVVAYDYGAAREYIRDGENGLLAPFAEEEAFLARIDTLATQPELMQSLRETAACAMAELQADAVSRRLETLMAQLAGEAA